MRGVPNQHPNPERAVSKFALEQAHDTGDLLGGPDTLPGWFGYVGEKRLDGTGIFHPREHAHAH